MREFSYQDLVSVTRTRNTISFDRIQAEKTDPTKEERQHVATMREVVKLELSSGGDVSIVLQDTFLTGAQTDEFVPYTKSDEVTEIIRTFVREKKRSVVSSPRASSAAASAFDKG